MELEISDIITEQYGIPKFPDKTPEAMAFVPFQQYNSPIYSANQGLESGTMFPALNKPFYGSKCGGNND